MRGRNGLILSVILGLIVLLLFWFFFVSPQRSELAEVRAQVAAEEARTQQLTAELSRLQDLQENAAELEAELETIRRFVPARPELANFIFQVQDAANAAGLDFVQISPELPDSPPEGAALAEVRAGITASGGYFALQDFLRRLHDLDRAVRVDTLDISAQDVTGTFGTRLSMQMNARFFFELPDPVAVTTAPPPGATPTPTPTPTP